MEKYVIKAGDTLSKIARAKGFSDWRPIWNYNTKIEHTLTSGNPDLVEAGVTIIIPRTRDKYIRAISGLTELLDEMIADSQALLADLDEAKREADAFGKSTDFISDLAMIGKGAVKATIKLGSKRLVHCKLRKETLRVAQKTAIYLGDASGDSQEELVVQNAGDAVLDQSIMIMARRQFDGAKVGRSFTKGIAKDLGKKGTRKRGQVQSRPARFLILAGWRRGAESAVGGQGVLGLPF